MGFRAASMTIGLILASHLYASRGNGNHNLWIKSFKAISFASFHGDDFILRFVSIKSDENST